LHSEMLVGLAISLASMTAGLYILHRLVALDLGEPAARTTVLLIAFFPLALFFSAVYTESLFLLLSVGAIYAARLDRWAWAGVLGGLASATRSAGVLLALALVVMYVYGPRTGGQRLTLASWWRPRYRVTRSMAWLALVPIGMIAYLAYLGIAHGQPLATFSAQQTYWEHYFAGPFGAVVHAAIALPEDVRRVVTGSGRIVISGDPISWNAHELIELGFLAFTIVGLIGAWRRVPFPYFVYAVALLAQPLSMPTHLEPLQSISRYVMVIFPAFMGWAALLERRRTLTKTILGVFTVLLAVFSGLWAMWVWVA
jgi:Mannosyltransferase (PIG-V)